MPSLFFTQYIWTRICDVHSCSFPNSTLIWESTKQPRSNLSKKRKVKTLDGENRTCAFFTLAYFNKMNKHEQKCEVVVIRSAGLVVPNSGVSYSQSLPRWSMLMAWKKSFYYYILLLCGCFEARLRVFCRWCVKQYRKVVRSTWSMWALSGPGLSVSQWLFTRLFSFHFTLLRGSSLWHRPLVCGPSVEASHDARLDILVGDLLVVVVRAAARWVHRRGRHGVEGEDELLSVTHAWRLGMVPGNTCEKVF